MNFIEEIIENGNIENLKFRFPPEPNGYLHLGHAKAICLNFGLAEKYGAKCNLRFDDTNPLTEDKEFTDAIIEDVEWLGFEFGTPKYTSDYFTFLHTCAIRLIDNGLAYVDDLTSEEIASYKGTLEKPGDNSPYRDRTAKENHDLFKEMILGNSKSVLRAKIDMKSGNMIMRDPVIYRVINSDHHKTGATFKAYPMYDFAHPLSDWLESITHSLCTMEFEAHRPFYNWLLTSLNMSGPSPTQIEFSRLNVENTILSKRYLKDLVEEGKVDDWDDPRMPTLSGLRRRGYTPSSIITFCDKVGVTRRETEISNHLLEECLREELNETSNRRMVVLDPIKLTVRNWPSGTRYYAEIENIPGDEDAGTRRVSHNGVFYIEREDFREEANRKYHRLKIGGEVRLKGAYVVKAIDCIKDDEGNILEVICDYDPSSLSGMNFERKIKGTIHWVSADYCMDIEVREFNVLEKTVSNAKGELSLDNLRDEFPTYPVQFMRKGYYIIDCDSTNDKMVFNKTVSLKSSYKG
jgi:glutaminyl-tRNA synthetase